LGAKKSFGSLPVLRGIDLVLEEGEIAVLTEPSGSGKEPGWVKASSAKRLDPEANMTALEREIDSLVYELYGLTPAKSRQWRRAAR
jgi:ABC-type branched-subunit amino acid transport system ATPase component